MRSSGPGTPTVASSFLSQFRAALRCCARVFLRRGAAVVAFAVVLEGFAFGPVALGEAAFGSAAGAGFGRATVVVFGRRKKAFACSSAVEMR